VGTRFQIVKHLSPFDLPTLIWTLRMEPSLNRFELRLQPKPNLVGAKQLLHVGNRALSGHSPLFRRKLPQCSSRADLPEPFSPIRKLTGVFRLGSARARIAGMLHGHAPKSSGSRRLSIERRKKAIPTPKLKYT
jgi:hypothetical protein